MDQRITAFMRTDQIYYLAYKSLVAQNGRLICRQTLKSCSMLALYLRVTLQDDPYEPVVPFLVIFNVCTCLYALLFRIMMSASKYNKLGVYLAIALKTNHCLEEELIANPTSIQYCVSDRTYIKDHPLERAQMTETQHKLILQVTKNNITNILKMTFPWVKHMGNSSALLSIASMVWTIIVLSTTPLDVLSTIALSVYVTVVGLSNITLLVFLLLIALSPVICFFMLFYCCCCAKGKKGGQFINLPSRQATNNDILNLGGDCSICHMSVELGQKVYELPCSEKHVFHTRCLNQWAKIKDNCPICRGEIPMTAKGRESQIIE